MSFFRFENHYQFLKHEYICKVVINSIEDDYLYGFRL